MCMVGGWGVEGVGEVALVSNCLHPNLDLTFINCVSLGKLLNINVSKPVLSTGK